MRWILGGIEVALIVVHAVVGAAAQAPAPQQTVPRQPAAQQQGAGAKAAAAEEQGRVTRARDLLGLEVLSEGGESYGIVDDLMINRRTGQVEFVLVETEKDSENLHPMPWKTLALYQGEDARDQYLILGMKQEQFQKAPTIVREQWPTMTYTQWNAFVPRVNTFYGPVTRAEARAVRRTARAIQRAVD